MDDPVQQAASALRAGNKDEARKLLAAVLRQSPNDERAWQWMFNAANNDIERNRCLEQVLRINPRNIKASELLKELQFAPTNIEQPTAPDDETYVKKMRRWVKGDKSWPEMDTFSDELKKRKLENKAFTELVDPQLKKCPYCTEMVNKDAQVCKHCGKNINPTVVKAEQWGSLGKSMQSLGCLLTLLVSVPACLCALYLMFNSK